MKQACRSTHNKVKMATDNDHDVTQPPVFPPLLPSIGPSAANNATSDHSIESPTPHNDTVLVESPGTVAAVNPAAQYDLDLDANTSVSVNFPTVDFGANTSGGVTISLGNKDKNTSTIANILAWQ